LLDYDKKPALTTDQTHCTAADAIIDALLEGLRLADRSLNDKCTAALADIGKPAFPALMRILEHGQNREPHRNRLLAVARRISNGTRSGVGVAQNIVVALLDAVRSDNPLLVEKVRAAFRVLHPQIANRLILEAVCCRNKVRYCLRLLDLVGELDHEPDGRGLADLGVLSEIGRKEISKRAISLLIQFGPRRRMCGFPPRSATQQSLGLTAEQNHMAAATADAAGPIELERRASAVSSYLMLTRSDYNTPP
jgi:hypothetical protein